MENKTMDYRFEVVDALGRRWVRTMTRIKAAKIVERLKIDKGLDCTIKSIEGGN